MKKKSDKTDAQKIKSIHKICNGLQRKNGMSDDKKKNCEIGIGKKWGIKMKTD